MSDTLLRKKNQIDSACETVAQIAADLEFVALDAPEILSALKQARKRGVRGGRVHDFLHTVAAEKCKAGRLLTLDRNDFHDLADTLTIEQV